MATPIYTNPLPFLNPVYREGDPRTVYQGPGEGLNNKADIQNAMVINPPFGINQAVESSKPELQGIQDAVNNILRSLGIKSILDMFSNPGFQHGAMPILGAALGGGGMGSIGEAIGRGGGASSISAPSAPFKTVLETGVQPQPQRGITEALNAALPLMNDPIGIQRISDLLKLLGGK